MGSQAEGSSAFLERPPLCLRMFLSVEQLHQRRYEMIRSQPATVGLCECFLCVFAMLLAWGERRTVCVPRWVLWGLLSAA